MNEETRRAPICFSGFFSHPVAVVCDFVALIVVHKKVDFLEGFAYQEEPRPGPGYRGGPGSGPDGPISGPILVYLGLSPPGLQAR